MYLLVPIFKWFPLKLQNASFLYIECYFLADQDNLPSLKSVLRFLISGNYIASKDKVWVELEYKISENCTNIESWHPLKGSYPGMLKKLGSRLKTKKVSFRGEGRYCLPTKKRMKSYLGLSPIWGEKNLTPVTEGHQSLFSIVVRGEVEERKNSSGIELGNRSRISRDGNTTARNKRHINSDTPPPKIVWAHQMTRRK